MKEMCVLVGGMTVALLVFLFPPWYADLGQKGVRDPADLRLGRSFIGSPMNAEAQIDWSLLVIELAAVGLLVLLALYAMGRRH